MVSFALRRGGAVAGFRMGDRAEGEAGGQDSGSAQMDRCGVRKALTAWRCVVESEQLAMNVMSM